MRYTFDLSSRRGYPISESSMNMFRASEHTPCHILIVDDDEQMLHLMAVMLERHGHAVTCASNGGEALSIVATAKRPFDLVVMDVLMRHLDGFEAYQEILELAPGLPVLFVSGSTPRTSAREIASHSYPFLAKPFTPEALTQAVYQVVDSGIGRNQMPRSESATW